MALLSRDDSVLVVIDMQRVSRCNNPGVGRMRAVKPLPVLINKKEF
jgi:ribosome biogenesis GTPase A